MIKGNTSLTTREMTVVCRSQKIIHGLDKFPQIGANRVNTCEKGMNMAFVNGNRESGLFETKHILGSMTWWDIRRKQG